MCEYSCVYVYINVYVYVSEYVCIKTIRKTNCVFYSVYFNDIIRVYILYIFTYR